MHNSDQEDLTLGELVRYMKRLDRGVEKIDSKMDGLDQQYLRKDIFLAHQQNVNSAFESLKESIKSNRMIIISGLTVGGTSLLAVGGWIVLGG